MSCYWDIEFSAIGSNDRIRELGSTIRKLEFDDVHWQELSRELILRNEPSLFHHVEAYKLVAGFVAVHACRNYYGNEAMSELIARFSDLTFQGMISTDAQEESYTLFEGRDGEMTIEYCQNTYRDDDPLLRGDAR
jgi:hypothetical protein